VLAPAHSQDVNAWKVSYYQLDSWIRAS